MNLNKRICELRLVKLPLTPSWYLRILVLEYFLKFQGVVITSAKKEKFLNPWNYFFKVYSVNTEYRF